ncbi:MAG: hypothetical protein KAR11_00730 [Phycisphaerae bacterium]|nr:hypothetical protein [Phycisphaerae bacterium]
MRNIILSACMFALAPLLLFGEKPSAETPKSQEAPKGVVKFKHLLVDRDNGVITIDTKVAKSEHGLEFLLCRDRTKEYESLLSTKATGRQLHAGLLMLGLDPGKPAEYDGEKYIPPRGAGLKISLQWKDKDGVQQQVNVDDWITTDKKDKQKFTPDRFIFVGSEILPNGTYQADTSGGLISLANLSSSVLDVPFESTRTLENRRFSADTDKLPTPGTKVQLVITPEKNAVNAPHARAMLEIDRLGQLLIDGQRIDYPQLQKWAQQYTDQHKLGRVVIRSAGRAMCVYGAMAKLELKLGGVFEFEEYTAPMQAPLLPQTPAQLKVMLSSLKKRLADPDEQINNPKREITRTLDQIQRQRAELKRLDGLWTEYEKSLKELEKSK